MRRIRAVALLLAAALVASAGVAEQRDGRFGPQRRGGRFGPQVRMATPQSFDGSFNFCRIIFRYAPDGDGGGWGVDYPRADENFSIRLSELTKTPISHDAEGEPNYLLVRLTDPELFQCPFVMMTEPGGAFFDDQEAAALRNYLLKGGFLWADGFWGEYAWTFWESQLRKALPSASYPIFDVPLDHPIFHEFMRVSSIPQIPAIDFWERRRSTSERGADSAVPHVRAIDDDHGRIIVLMTHNTDFGDAYEREGDDHEYFERFSVPGYAVGVNVVLYAMTH